VRKIRTSNRYGFRTLLPFSTVFRCVRYLFFFSYGTYGGVRRREKPVKTLRTRVNSAKRTTRGGESTVSYTWRGRLPRAMLFATLFLCRKKGFAYCLAQMRPSVRAVPFYRHTSSAFGLDGGEPIIRRKIGHFYRSP